MNHKSTTDNELRIMLKQANEYMRGDVESVKRAIPLYSFVLKKKDTVSVAKYIVPRMTYCICKTYGLNKADDFYEKMIRRYGNSVEDPELTIRMALSFINARDMITAMKLVNRLERLNRTDLKGRIHSLKNDIIYNDITKRKRKPQRNTAEKQKPKRKRKKRNQLPPLSKSGTQKVDYKPTAHRGDYTDVPSAYKGAELVNKSPSKPLSHTEAVLEARKFLDPELYPYGMRYGDATRYRRKKRRK